MASKATQPQAHLAVRFCDDAVITIFLSCAAAELLSAMQRKRLRFFSGQDALASGCRPRPQLRESTGSSARPTA
jgi:hypothetical protein